MKTEIPKEDGWYWIRRPCRITTVARLYTDGYGWLIYVVNPRDMVVLEIHRTHETLEGATFIKIEVPR